MPSIAKRVRYAGHLAMRKALGRITAITGENRGGVWLEIKEFKSSEYAPLSDRFPPPSLRDRHLTASSNLMRLVCRMSFGLTSNPPPRFIRSNEAYEVIGKKLDTLPYLLSTHYAIKFFPQDPPTIRSGNKWNVVPLYLTKEKVERLNSKKEFLFYRGLVVAKGGTAKSVKFIIREGWIATQTESGISCFNRNPDACVADIKEITANSIADKVT